MRLVEGMIRMNTLARTPISTPASTQELSYAGSSLELPYVFDASARELKAMADRGLVKIIDEHTSCVANEMLIDRLHFRRLS